MAPNDDQPGWIHRTSPEFQREFMDGMLRAMALQKQAREIGDVAVLETSATNALDAQSWVGMLHGVAAHVREQATKLGELAAEWDAMAELIDREHPA